MNRIFIIVTFLISGLTVSYAQKTLQERAMNLISDPAFVNALVGIKAVTGSGDTLVKVNSDKLLVPASNMKLVSTGNALVKLGADFRYRTDLAHDGVISDGILHGNLYIVGNGDPLIGSKDSIATPLESTFREWENIVRKAGIRHIHGHIIGDGRWLDGMIEEPTWQWNDIGTYYGTGLSGLNFHENMISFNVSVNHNNVKEPLNIKQVYPSTSWLDITNSGTVGEKGTGDRLYMYTSELAPIAEIRGTFGIDRGPKRVDFSNKYPEYTCAVYFKNFLEKSGITCTRGAADFKLKNEWISGQKPPYGISLQGDSLKFIGSTYSPSLSEIVFKTNHESNNLLAEALFRTLGKEDCGDSSYEPSRSACLDALKEIMSTEYSPVHIQDGSGLSRQNLISADFMCSFLQSMMRTDCFEDFLWSLAVPAENGSMRYNMTRFPKELRQRIRVKSGSMSNIRCYSGYILPADYTPAHGAAISQEVREKIIVFSILTGNLIAPPWKVSPPIEKFMAGMAGF